MSALEIVVPDLLRRFAPAEYCTRAVLHGFQTTLQTNDAEIVAAVRGKHSTHADGAPANSVLIRLIRDDGAPSDPGQLTIVTAWPLVTLLLGAGTMLTLDCERREILGFVAPWVPAERVVHEMLLTLFDFLRSGGA